MYALPESINDESNRILAGIIERRFAALDLTVLLVYLIEDVNASALPHLMEQFHVAGIEGGALAENVTNRRTLVKSAIAIHKLKGTPAGIKRAIREAGFGEVVLLERPSDHIYNGEYSYNGAITYNGDPTKWACYHVVMERAITNDQAVLMRALCAEVAPGRCQLLDLIYTETALRYNAGVNYDGAYNYGAA